MIAADGTGSIFTASGLEKIKAVKVSVSKPTTLTLLDDDRFAVGDERGNIFEFDSNGKTLWKFKTGARISSIVATKDGLLASSYDNFVYMLSYYRGSVVWKRRLSSRSGKLAGTYGSLTAISVPAESSIVLVDTQNGKLRDSLTVTGVLFSEVPAIISGSGTILVPTSKGISAFSETPCNSNEKATSE